MTYRIIQTNRTERRISGIDHLTGAAAERVVVYEPGRVIAEHADQRTTRKHAAKIQRCHRDIEFMVWPTIALVELDGCQP